MDIALLLAGWVLWCAVHSLLIAPKVTTRLRRLMGWRYAYFRLIYNLFALASLLPLYVYTHVLDYPFFWEWRGLWRAVPLGMFALALWLFYAGARAYNLREFFGLEQIAYSRRGQEMPASPFKQTGVLAHVRHPWYLAGFLVLWARDFNIPWLGTVLILSSYLMIGAHLEERKLLGHFGSLYRQYCRQVPMIVPWKWFFAPIGRLFRNI